VLTTLRSVLGGDRQDVSFLVSNRDAVRIDITAVDIDVEHFAAQEVDALEAWRRHGPDAVALLQDAVMAYGGEFCAEDAYEQWASALRDELETLHLSVVRALAVARQAAGEVDEAVRWFLAVLRADPYDESAHLALVRTLHGAGRYGDARRRYEQYVEPMADIAVPAEPFPGRSGPSTGYPTGIG
jgi:DNA-binding SARP family transcriptional activator